MASFVEISSNALRLIGDDPITSFSDDTERARLVNAIYEEMRRIACGLLMCFPVILESTMR